MKGVKVIAIITLILLSALLPGFLEVARGQDSDEEEPGTIEVNPKEAPPGTWVTVSGSDWFYIENQTDTYVGATLTGPYDSQWNLIKEGSIVWRSLGRVMRPNHPRLEGGSFHFQFYVIQDLEPGTYLLEIWGLYPTSYPISPLSVHRISVAEIFVVTEGTSPPPTPTMGEAEIRLDPASGGPGIVVEVEGDGFDPHEEVEVRWDASDGDLLAEEKADGNGGFTTPIIIPLNAGSGRHWVLAVSPQGGVRATANFTVTRIYISGKAFVPLKGGLPLREIEIFLFWDPQDGSGLRLLGATFTDRDGNYEVSSPVLSVPMRGRLMLQATLNRATAFLPGTVQRFGVFDLSEKRDGVGFVDARFGKDGIGVETEEDFFRIESDADLRRDLKFEDLEDKSGTRLREDHALDAALIYYHSHQAITFYEELGVPLARLRILIYSWLGTLATFNNVLNLWDVHIGEGKSDWNDGNAPKNREWHEISHYILGSIYPAGVWPLRHEEVVDFSGNGIVDKDINHGGFSNNLTSSDAVSEGFAEFMAMVIADQMNRRGDPYMQNHLPPFVYTVSNKSALPMMINLEINYRHMIPKLKADEELWVASLLWDVYDGVDDGDHDHLDLSIEEIWTILTRTYSFPQYYNGIVITSFTGDNFTYAGQASGFLIFGGQRRLRAPFPRVLRNIYYVRDLYDALSWSIPDKRRVDEVFFSHGIYMDTFLKYEDYHALTKDSISIFKDEGSDVSLSIDSEAAYEFWGRGIVADLTVSGWGAGFTVDKYPYFDAGGHLYLFVWIDAPEGTPFDIVVEDDEGQWLCAGTSQILIDFSEIPQNIEHLQKGTGKWEGYVVVLKNSYAAKEIGFVCDFRPNKYHKTPATGALGPDLRSIRGVGVLFYTPGSYKVMVGGIAVVRDYPWKMGFKTIMGIMDPSKAPVWAPYRRAYNMTVAWRPYRRDYPPPEGSKALITLSEAPATLMVSMNYAPPYNHLSFTYPLNMTEKTQEIWLYIDPAFEGEENTLTLVAVKDGVEISRPTSINSSYYWEHLGQEKYVLTHTFETKLPSWFTVWFPFLIPFAENLQPIVPMPYTPYAALIIPLAPTVSLIIVGSVLLSRRKKKVAGLSLPSPPPPQLAAARFCSNCGRSLKPKDKFCRNCGTRTN